MAEESQISPLAPSGIYLRSDEEFALAKPNKPNKHKSSKLLVYILIAIVLLSTAMLILASVFFKTKSPKAKITSVTISNLQNGAVGLNFTMVSEITVVNKNFGRFELKNSTASVFHGNVSIGEGDINGARVRARKTGVMSLTVQVRSNEILSNNTDFENDIGLGLVKLSSYAELRGRVHVTDIVNKHHVAILNCTMSLNLKLQAIQHLKWR